ncbi:MAG TPA: hypothetical protein VFQ92_19310 [Blastocatellia bacterium]|nr:hypothetical protein [Blastocatellia bacterium]
MRRGIFLDFHLIEQQHALEPRREIRMAGHAPRSFGPVVSDVRRQRNYAMTQEKQEPDITKRKVVFQLPNMDAVSIRRDVDYQSPGSDLLTMDIYYPPDSMRGDLSPAVVFVLGYSDLGFQRMLGCKQKDMLSYISWGKLVAASGMVAITYTTTEPTTDALTLLRYVRDNCAALGIDKDRIGLWACSGNVPNALWVLMQENSVYLKCAVLCYGLMLDLEGATVVAESAKKWGFVNPCAGKSVTDLQQTAALYIVRAGKDETPYLNETIDRFISQGLKCNLPITFVNYEIGQHSFDVMDDSETTRELIRRMLEFMQYQLLGWER